VAGIGLEKYATGHEMSNQQSQKPVLPKHSTKLDRLGKSDGYLLLRSVTFFALLADAFAVEIWSHMGQTTSTAWKNNCGIVAPLRMARVPSRFTTRRNRKICN